MRLHNAGKQYALGHHCSEETRQKISDAKKGKPKSAETRQRMSDAKKNMSAETRQRMSEAHKGKQNALGHHWNVSAETRKKISAAHKGKHWHVENGKHVYTD